MSRFNSFDEKRHTAIYVRISTASQKTDRQETELKEFALRNGLNFNEKTDMYIDIISGFKEGEARSQYSILKNKVEAGLYQQILFSEFSRLDRKPSNLLRCGECGSRFTSAMCRYGRSYKCTGKMPTKRRPRICFLGADVLMYKLDGLVIQLCIRKFTGYDLRRKAMGKVVELEGEIDSKRTLQQSYRDIAQELHENYSAVMKRIIRFAKDDAEAENWITSERSKYERKCEENSKVIDTLKNEIAGLNRRRTSLLKVEDKPEFAERQAEILMDRSLVKEYINEYIQDIVMYNPSDMWILVIIHFMDGSERWGTVKKGKYGISQSGQEKIYTGWFIDNDDHLFSYDRETHKITEKITSLVHKTYTFEEFNDIAAARGWMGEFKPYEY